MIRLLPLLLAAACAAEAVPVEGGDADAGAERRGDLVPVGDFGDLRMLEHVPAGLEGPAPLVVVLHGCGQTAAGYAGLTDWVALSERRRFLLVFAETRWGACFGWYLPVARDRGQALAVKQMVDTMKTRHAVDDARVFVTGFSAGGYMTTAALAAYPDVFAAGAVLEGGPAGCDALCMSFPERTPEAWAAAARAIAPGYDGPYPRLLVFHGALDGVVVPHNLDELTEQWTALHDGEVLDSEWVRGHLRRRTVSGGEVVLETWLLAAFPHAIPVDPGDGEGQGGKTGLFAVDAGLWSSYVAAQFFGI